MRDEELKEGVQEFQTSNHRVYGARKIWRELNRQGHAVARRTVERLMRELGISGAVRGKKVITTLPGGQAERAPDRLERDFVVATFSRRLVGWSAATVKAAVFVLDDAVEMAIRQRDRDQLPVQPGELIRHSDAGSQYTSFRHAEHLDAADIAATLRSLSNPGRFTIPLA
ncbi:IS3 family transposase [Streptomyces sp. NPDC007205]|uniref:IS3 family transposase n=1 Tax=Streptomyces sp. NPDC007205 TaxID=3154316 RepID=UPI0033D4DE14